MQKIIIIILSYIISSCSFLPESTGRINEIIILTSKEDQELIKPILSNIFSNVVHTPQPEELFILKFHDIEEFNFVKEYRNIIFASINYPADSTGDLLMDRFLNKYKNNNNLFSLSDLYAKNQIFCIINSHDAIEFQQIIEKNREWILNEYTSFLEEIIHAETFKNGTNDDLSDRIHNIFGYSINLQIDFQEIKSDSINSFFWAGRGYPYRWITLHKSNQKSYFYNESAWEQLEKEFNLNMPEIKISQYYRKIDNVLFENTKIPIMRGIFEHDESNTGGSFFVYIFDTEQSNEVILISGFVNHPGHEKLMLIKQLEIMAKTLHKGESI